VGGGGGGGGGAAPGPRQKVLSKPSADSFAVGRRQKSFLLTTDKYSAVFTKYSVAEYSADHYSAEYSADRIVGH
jgi:hypothetical protein